MFYIGGVPQRHLPLLLPLLVLAAMLAAPPAFAACTSPAAPEVNWRRCLLDGQDLSGANLTLAHLRDASFTRARLGQAVMVGIDAANARFLSADLTGADMTDATLRAADFTRATMRDAKLIRADLRRARLFRADLTGADLTGAELLDADFTGAILDGVRWTDGIRLCAVGSVGSCQ